MDKLLIVLALYYAISIGIAIGFIIELAIIKHSNDKTIPVLKEDITKTNIKAFASGLWLPLLLYKCFINFVKG